MEYTGRGRNVSRRGRGVGSVREIRDGRVRPHH